MEITSAAEQKLDYLSLLVTELRNQNPLDPVEQKDMAAQLAQFSQLELTEEMNGNLSSMNESMASMNSNFDSAMLMAKLDYAQQLLGQDINFYESLSGENMVGHVTKITFSDSELVLTADTGSDNIGQVDITLDQVLGIQI